MTRHSDTTSTPSPDRSMTSSDGAWRFDLYATGRSDPWSRGETRAAYALRVVRTADGRSVFDSRRCERACVAWVPVEGTGVAGGGRGGAGGELRLGGSPSDSMWIIIDVARGEFWMENFREPITPTRSVEFLREGWAA